MNVGGCRVGELYTQPTSRQEKLMNDKTKIQIELSETVVVYSGRTERFKAFCPVCKSMVEMAPAPVAAVLNHTSEREIYRLVETGEVHFVETDRVLICVPSLPNREEGT
jgi:hypothetical protein